MEDQTPSIHAIYGKFPYDVQRIESFYAISDVREEACGGMGDGGWEEWCNRRYVTVVVSTYRFCSLCSEAKSRDNLPPAGHPHRGPQGVPPAPPPLTNRNPSAGKGYSQLPVPRPNCFPLKAAACVLHKLAVSLASYTP